MLKLWKFLFWSSFWSKKDNCKYFWCWNYENCAFDPFFSHFGPTKFFFVALWFPKLRDNVIIYIILLPDFINVSLWHNYTIRNLLLSFSDFGYFGGRPGGAQNLGCQSQNLTFWIPGMYSQINFPSFEK